MFFAGWVIFWNISWTYFLFFSIQNINRNIPCHDISFHRSDSVKYIVFEHAHFHNLFLEVNKHFHSEKWLAIVQELDGLMVIFDLIDGVKIGVKFITVWIVILLIAVNHNFSFSTFQRQKNTQKLRLLWCKLVNRAPSDQSNSSQSKLWTPGPKSRICSSHFVDREPRAENPHPTLNLGYPNFEKRVQAILSKKRKTKTSTDGINRVRINTFQELLLKKKIN